MVTLPQLVEILKNNWEGNQVLQMKMINEGAKFGNGQKEAGNLACEMVNYFVERVERHTTAGMAILSFPRVSLHFPGL